MPRYHNRWLGGFPTSIHSSMSCCNVSLSPVCHTDNVWSLIAWEWLDLTSVMTAKVNTGPKETDESHHHIRHPSA